MVARAAEAQSKGLKVILGVAHTRWLRSSFLNDDAINVLAERGEEVLLGLSSGSVLITLRNYPSSSWSANGSRF